MKRASSIAEQFRLRRGNYSDRVSARGHRFEFSEWETIHGSVEDQIKNMAGVLLIAKQAADQGSEEAMCQVRGPTPSDVVLAAMERELKKLYRARGPLIRRKRTGEATPADLARLAFIQAHIDRIGMAEHQLLGGSERREQDRQMKKLRQTLAATEYMKRSRKVRRG